MFRLAANNGVTDNNGVIIELPAVGAAGALSVAGSLVFGIGTQPNNALSSAATVLTTDPYSGYVSTAFNGHAASVSYFDTGTNSINFDDSSIPDCSSLSDFPGYFCPSSPLSLSATVTGTNAQAVLVNFSIASAQNLYMANPNFTAYSNLGGTTGQSGAGSFAWGLPVFFGLNVYFAMENTDAGGTFGPYVAL